ncbi:phage portal protein [Microbacterium plantarum]|uniref:phage portal protein n=1 Tax=Microbacterium plantarum TaxID=1816425 RepID=UPI002B48AD72|nr:phage portal protein [Microbacterium plantarum]WRK16508.1 phage portal protein [Microbacterium plantarum]
MKRDEVVELATEILIPGWQTEKQKLDLIDKWYRWEPGSLRDKIPSYADTEHRNLAKISETPMLALIVTTVSQQLVAESVRSSRSGDDVIETLMLPWRRNRMPSRQRAIYRAALAYGYSYATVMPGDTGAVIRGRSPRDLYAVYQDVVEDEYPMYYLLKRGDHMLVVDEEAVYTLGYDNGRVEYIDDQTHGAGVAPAIRYSNQIDLEGRTPGEVEPYIQTAERINKDTYDRMLVQHFNSWKVRYATGLDMPTDPADVERVKTLLRQNDILTGEEGVTFGTLDETNPDGLIKAVDKDIEILAVVSQTPTHALTGSMVNLSADAIAESRAMLDLKTGERKVGFGDSNEQVLRLAAHLEGRPDDAADFTLQMQWADLQSRSMSQAADSLGKLATMLGIPVELLWDRIPGVTPEIAKSWLEYKQENPSADEQLAAALTTQSNGFNG